MRKQWTERHTEVMVRTGGTYRQINAAFEAAGLCTFSQPVISQKRRQHGLESPRRGQPTGSAKVSGVRSIPDLTITQLANAAVGTCVAAMVAARDLRDGGGESAVRDLVTFLDRHRMTLEELRARLLADPDPEPDPPEPDPEPLRNVT